MTENETLELLKKANRDNDMVCILPKSDMGKCLIKALEENQRWHISEVNPSIKNVFANMSTQICHNCDHKDEYIEELEAEIQQYRAISTVEECRAAVEKQTAKKVISFEYHNGTINYGCPVCKWKIISKINGEWCCGTFNEYCDRCGQKLDWSDEDGENMTYVETARVGGGRNDDWE